MVWDVLYCTVCTVVAKSFETQNVYILLIFKNVLIFTNSAASVCKMAIAYTPECYEQWSDELQSPSLPCKWTESSKKTFPLHFTPATKGPAEIMSVILSLTSLG